MAPKPKPRGQRTDQETASNYPSGVASELTRIAREVSWTYHLNKELDKLRKMRPKPRAVRRTAEKWYSASSKINDSLNKLEHSYINLGVKWEGDAYDAFEKFIKSDVIKTADHNSDVLFEIGNSVIELHNSASNAFMEGVKEMSTTLKEIAALDPDKDKDTIISTLKLFALNRKNTREKLKNEMDIKAAKISSLAGQAKQISSPEDFPKDALDKNEWTYDPS